MIHIHVYTHMYDVISSNVLYNLCGRDRTRNTGMIVCQVCSENFQTNINCESAVTGDKSFSLSMYHFPPLFFRSLRTSGCLQWLDRCMWSSKYMIVTPWQWTHSHTLPLLILRTHIHFTITTMTCICWFWDTSAIFQTRTCTIIRNQSVLWSSGQHYMFLGNLL